MKRTISFDALSIEHRGTHTSPKILRPGSDSAKKRKTITTSKKPKERSTFLDLDSPYSEFLPALYREWAPTNLDKVSFYGLLCACVQ